MRGKHDHARRFGRVGRIIPAHAGQTPYRHSFPCRNTDHPRACGANMDGSYGAQCWDGSSPRMRGKLILTVLRQLLRRIIPAHAGQTSPADTGLAPSADHPRACGANYLRHHTRQRRNGSSPRMRGKLWAGMAAGRPGRIIPAHAGQTGTYSTWLSLEPDHPRACGANLPRWMGRRL